VVSASTENGRIETVGSAADGTSGISDRRLIINVIGLCLTIFLTALDRVYFLKSHVNKRLLSRPQFRQSVRISVILHDIHGLELHISSLGYFLYLFTDGGTVPLPLYGKVSDIWGRKPILFVSIGFFELGSPLYGSRNMKMLLASRVIQGFGGGGIMGIVNIIMSDITSLRYPTVSHNILTVGTAPSGRRG